MKFNTVQDRLHHEVNYKSCDLLLPILRGPCPQKLDCEDKRDNELHRHDQSLNP